MKKMLTVMAGVMIAGSLMSSVAKADVKDVLLGAYKATWSPFPIETIANSGTDADEPIGMPSPITDVKDLKEAEELTGVKLTVPKTIKGYDDITYHIFKDSKLVQVIYKNGDKDSINIRKGESKEDISGDYDEYEKTKKVTIKKYKVTLKGDGKTYSLATWKKGKYAYSVGIYNEDEKGMSLKQIKNIVSKVK